MNDAAANVPEFFEQRAGYAVFAPAGVVSLSQAAELVTRVIIFAREHQIERVLVDALGLGGFPSPSVVDRYWIMRQWANAAKSRVAIAVVVAPHMIDPERFGVMVGANSGMRADVFTSRTEAVEWLLSSRPASVNPSTGF